MFARHDLVWLSDAGWRQARACVRGSAATAVAAWRKAGWPAVVRRAEVDGQVEMIGALAIGLALPPGPDGRKVRIACRVDAAEVLRRESALPLKRAIAQLADLAPRWCTRLAELDRQAQQQGLAIRVYGSVALQALTGQACLREGSDIDVLLHPRSRAELDAALALLGARAGLLPLDGEIVFPGGRAVAWRELSAALAGARGARVLVKDLRRVCLAPLDELIATLQEEPC